MDAPPPNRDNVEFFERFSRYYQQVYARIDAEETVRQWRMLLEKKITAMPRQLDLVDVGCGPGWHLSAWAKAGFNVAGIDSSPSMLAVAERNFSSDPGGQCPLYLGDIRDLAVPSAKDRMPQPPVPASFDVAVTHFNFLNLFGPTELERVFAGVALLVRPGALWLADYLIPASPPLPVAEEYESETGEKLRCVGAWNPNARCYNQTWRAHNLDVEEVFWFHDVRKYQECALASGWRTEGCYEWCPTDRLRPWCSAANDSERVVALYRRN